MSVLDPVSVVIVVALFVGVLLLIFDSVLWGFLFLIVAVVLYVCARPEKSFLPSVSRIGT